MASLKPRALGDLRVGRVPQEGAAAADEQRHIGRAHMKLLEHLLRFGVAIEVDVVERLAVAGQELPHPERAGTMRRAKQDEVAHLARDELAAAEHERPHQDGAQLSVGLHEGQELLAIELDDLARLGDARRRHGPAAGDQRDFAGELTRPVRDDERSVGAGHLERAADDHEERDGPGAGLDQHLALGDRAAPAACRNPRHLRVGQRREQPFGGRGRGRLQRERLIDLVHRSQNNRARLRLPRPPPPVPARARAPDPQTRRCGTASGRARRTGRHRDPA